jgi:signal transduction histidine kinase
MSVKNPIEAQLKEAGQITGASWAVLLEREIGLWQVRMAHQLGVRRRSVLLGYLGHHVMDSWLCGALAGGHIRSRTVSPHDKLDCPRLYVFPIEGTAMVLLIGGNIFNDDTKRLWRIVAASIRLWETAHTGLQTIEAGPLLPDIRAEIPYDMPKALDHILKAFVRVVPCQGGWLAIHRGDILEIRSQWNCPQCLGNRLSIETNAALRRVNRTLHGLLIENSQPEWSQIPRKGLKNSTHVWACLPMVIGQRLIGATVLWRGEPFSPSEWRRLQNMTVQVTPSVEVIITFAEMADHLQRLAMLNDFALTVSSAQNLDQIVRRVFALLARTFGIEMIALFLLSSDRRTLREYRNPGGKVTFQTLPVEGHPFATFLNEGKTIRLDHLDVSLYAPVSVEVNAVLIVPLKHRGRTIGILLLESKRVEAFSIHDEHLLVVIASHLAGLVEYGRLREEAEARARNLGLIHEVVQQVIGLTDVSEVAQITADLLAQYFTYELAAIVLVDPEKKLTITGFGGTRAEVVQRALSDIKYPIQNNGITGHVFATGESILVNDVSQDPRYIPLSGWAAGSEMCVALRDSDQILGIIDIESSEKNAFTHGDLLVLESLAGILAAVVSSADQHQRLQATIRQLRTTQDELRTRIEAQRSAENRLIQAAKLAAVGEMVAGIAHELNNPLTTVTGFTELLLEDIPENAPQRADMELILRESHRARDVVRRLLDFSRQSESVRARVNLNEIVTDVIALMEHFIHTSGVRLDVNLEKDLPWVSVDQNQMKQVLINLLYNALQAMTAGGGLTVCTAAQMRDGRQWLTVAVRDTGVGIPIEHKDRIFEPFFTTKANDGGTGLGLSVTYGIVTDHGGFIDVESEPGAGSCFTVWLPV